MLRMQEVAGSNPVVSTNPETGLSETCGSGLMNLEESFRLLEDYEYKYYYNNEKPGYDDMILVKTYTVTLQINDDVRIVNSYLRNMDIDVNGDVYFSSMDNYQLRVRYPNGTIEYLDSDYSNIEIMDFTASMSGTYKIYIYVDFKNDLLYPNGSRRTNWGYVIVNAGYDTDFDYYTITPPC